MSDKNVNMTNDRVLGWILIAVLIVVGVFSNARWAFNTEREDIGSAIGELVGGIKDELGIIDSIEVVPGDSVLVDSVKVK